jgi:hypothetical protein
LRAISPLDRVGRLRYLLSFVDVVVVDVEEVIFVHTNDGGRRQGQGGTITASNDNNGVRDGALAMKGAGTRQLTTYVNIDVNVDNARMISAGKGGGDGGGERSSGAQRNGGSAVATARRMRRWRQLNSAMSAATARHRYVGGSLAAARQRRQRQHHGGSAVAAAQRLRRWRQRNSATSAAAWRHQRRQWQHLRRWRQCNSATSAVAAARHRDVSGRLAAARQRRQRQRRWQQR